MKSMPITGASAVWSRSVFVLSLPAQVFGCSFYDGILLIPPYAQNIMPSQNLLAVLREVEFWPWIVWQKSEVNIKEPVLWKLKVCVSQNVIWQRKVTAYCGCRFWLANYCANSVAWEMNVTCKFHETCYGYYSVQPSRITSVGA